MYSIVVQSLDLFEDGASSLGIGRKRIVTINKIIIGIFLSFILEEVLSSSSEYYAIKFTNHVDQ